MPVPGSDRVLHAADVAAILREQFPHVDASSVTLRGSGWDNEVYATRDGWLLRFPKRAEVVPWFLREVSLQALVAQAVAPVAAPVFELVGRPCDRFPYPFVGYREVPGVPADTVPGPAAGVAAAYGGALSRLHAIDTALVAPTPGLWEREGWGAVWLEVWERSATIRARLPDDVRDAAEPYLAGDVPPPPFTGRKRVLHNDIGPDHLLVDPETGALTGIIDFGDVVVGDPIADVVGLVGWAGFGFCEEVLAHYDLELDDHSRDRLRWAARVVALHRRCFEA